MIPRRLQLPALVVAIVAIGACSHPSQSAPDSGVASAVTGTVGYQQRVSLPADAVVELSVVDAAAADSTSRVLATATVSAAGRQLPLPFSVPFDASRVRKQHLYTLRADIRSGSEMLFTTDIARAVITQGNPTNVDLLLTRVDPEASTASNELPGTSWVLQDLAGDGIVAGTHVTLDFSANGRATGNGSCNRYFATVEISGSSIRFGAVGATRMACATPVSLQEVRYFGALEAASEFTVEGNTLSISSGSGRPLRFVRAAP